MQKSLSNLIIEIKMEELRKRSLKLAIWDLSVSAVVFLITVLFLGGKNPAINEFNIKAFTAWNCVMYAALLPFLYYQWFKFFEAFKDAYPDNRNLINTIRLGKIAFILYSVAASFGLIASIFDAFIITPEAFGCDFNVHGIIPKNAVGSRCNDLITGAGYLMALMYYFLSRQTEPKSTMRVLTIILAIKVPFFLIVSLASTSIYLIFIDVIFWVTEFLFLMQIYNGYEFGKPKEEVPAGVQE